MSRVKSWLVEVGPITTLMVVCAWVVLLFAQLQAPLGDYGIFVSVAERLKAGDRLYVDVWNNRDPLFYFTLATARWATPLGGWLLEMARLALVAIAGYTLTRDLGTSRRVAALVGGVSLPVIATAVADPATGVLPGVAIALVGLGALMRRKYVLSGLLIGTVIFFKITLFPVAAAAFIAAVLVLRPGRPVWRIAAGAGASAFLVVALLGVRGELGAYLDSLRLNLQYSQEGQSAQGPVALIDHLSRTMTLTAQITLVAMVTAIALAMAAKLPGDRWRSDRLGAALLWAAIASGVMALGVLAVTGKWPGHAKLLIVPACLAMVLLAGRGPRILRAYRMSAVVTLLGLTLLLAGLPSWGPYLSHLEYARANLNMQGGIPREAALILETGPPSTYARVGQGDDPGHAIGLTDWKLACPRFQQYWWESDEVLGESLACLPEAKVILVTRDANREVTTPMWDRYLAGVEGLLARDYACTDHEGTRICTRMGSS